MNRNNIPKLIHYCWLSGDPVPREYKKRMRSWDKKLSGYELMLWDTNRFDINSTAWTQKAFDAKHYASAADYIRLYAVYHFGGIYLDMDIEVIKPFDDLLNADIFLAKETHVHNTIEAGCFGAEKGHPFIKKCLDWFDHNVFGGTEQVIMPHILYEIYEASFNTIPLFGKDYFTAKNVLTGKIEKTANTYTVHHFATKWISKIDHFERVLKRIIYRIFGETNVSESLCETIKKIRMLLRRIRNESFRSAMKYYFKKYFPAKKEARHEPE